MWFTYTESKYLKSRNSPTFPRPINPIPVLQGLKQKPRDWAALFCGRFHRKSGTEWDLQNNLVLWIWFQSEIQNLGLSSGSATNQLCGLQVSFNLELSLCMYIKGVGYKVLEDVPASIASLSMLVAEKSWLVDVSTLSTCYNGSPRSFKIPTLYSLLDKHIDVIFKIKLLWGKWNINGCYYPS